MATLTELTAEIVSAHASGSSLTSEELIKNIHAVYSTLKTLEEGGTVPAAETAPTGAPKLTIKQAFKKDEVVCMICGKGGLKILKRHLQVAHDMKPGQYRKQFNIPSSQALVAKNYSEQRKKDALDRGQADVLAKARAVKAAKNTGSPVVKTKAPVPTVKVKAPAPVKKVKSALPAKVAVSSSPAKLKKAPAVKSTAKAKK